MDVEIFQYLMLFITINGVFRIENVILHWNKDI